MKKKILTLIVAFVVYLNLVMLIGEYKNYVPPYKVGTCLEIDLRDFYVSYSYETKRVTSYAKVLTNDKDHSVLVIRDAGYDVQYNYYNYVMSYTDLRDVETKEVRCEDVH